MSYKMKGSPFQRNFGIGSPAKQEEEPGGKFAPKPKKKEEEEPGGKFETKAEAFKRIHGVTEEEFDKGNKEDDKKKLAEYNAKQAKKSEREDSLPQ